MSTSLRPSVRQVSSQLQQPAAGSTAAVHFGAAEAHLGSVAQSPAAAAQFADVGRPLAPPQQRVPLQRVPSSSSMMPPVGVLDDAFSGGSSSGSSTCGPAGGSYSCGGGGTGLDSPLQGVPPMPAPVPPPPRRVREFIPESKKDDEYWTKRQKNNEAAKRSREKRRANDSVMLRRIHELVAENKRLKVELDVLRRQLGMLPTTAESQPPQPLAAASAAASGMNAAGQLLAVRTEDRVTLSQQPEAPMASVTCYGVTAATPTSSYLSSGATAAGMAKPAAVERIQRLEETYQLYHHHHHHPTYNAAAPQSAVATYPSVSEPHSTSSGDAGTLSSSPTALYHHSTSSGNLLPSIRNLCGGSARPRQDSDQPPWSMYRSETDADRCSTSCSQRAPPSRPLPPPLPSLMDSSPPIMIFSDVSSSGDDSVDESLYGRHVDTLTLRPHPRVEEPVGGRGTVDEVDSPLNLSTPSRHHQSYSTGVSTRQPYCATDARAVLGRPAAVDLEERVGAPWLPAASTESPARHRHADAGMLGPSRLPAGCVSAPTSRGAPNAAAWLQRSTNGTAAAEEDTLARDQSSRSTSQSSMASVAAWQVGVDPPPGQDAPVGADDAAADQLCVGGSRQVGCGLPLKVRRKLGSNSSSASTARATGDDASRPPSEPDCAALPGAPRQPRSVQQLWSDDYGSATSRPPSSGAQCSSVSPEWFHSATTCTGRLAARSQFDVFDARTDRYK